MRRARAHKPLVSFSGPALTPARLSQGLHLFNPFCCAPLSLPPGGLDAAADDAAQAEGGGVPSVKLWAQDLTKGAGLDQDLRQPARPLRRAGCAAAAPPRAPGRAQS